GDDVDHAGHRHAAPQAGGAAADDLDVVDIGQRHLVELRGQVKRVDDRDAVEQDQHLGVAEATHPGLLAGRIGDRGGDAGEIETGNSTQQLVQRLCRRELDLVLAN